MTEHGQAAVMLGSLQLINAVAEPLQNQSSSTPLALQMLAPRERAQKLQALWVQAP